MKTGASHILNCKSVYNRSSLPRIVAMDSIEESTLGDTSKNENTEGLEVKELEPEPIQRTKKAMRLERMKDKRNWGEQTEETENVRMIDMSILSEGDEDLILCLDVLQDDDDEDAGCTGETRPETAPVPIQIQIHGALQQSKMTDWLTGG